MVNTFWIIYIVVIIMFWFNLSCIEKNNMIKKILWLLTFVWLSINCMYWTLYTRQTFPLNQNVTVGDLQWNSFIFRQNANFEYWSNSNKLVSYYGDWLYPDLRTFFWYNSWDTKWLYSIVSCEGWYSCSNIHTSIMAQWFVKSFCLTWYNDVCASQSYDAWLFYNWNDYSNPDSLTIEGWYHESNTTQSWQWFTLCFNYQSFNKSACFYFDRAYPNSNWQNSLWFAYNPFWNDLSLAEFKNWITTSPFHWNWNSGGGGWTTVVFNDMTVKDVTDYFEQNQNYWRTPELCKVWTNNLTSPYWTTGINYEYWKWKNIFELYDSIYWSWRTDEKVWIWLNSRMINWKQWFLTSPEKRLYLASFDWSTLILNYDNLTFPFANNPVAIYFMTNELMDHNVWNDWNLGYEFAVYCDYVINWEDAEEITKDYVKNNIENYIWNRNENNWKYQKPTYSNSWFWQRLENWSWNDTWNSVNFKDNFKKFYEKLTSVIDNIEWVDVSNNTRRSVRWSNPIVPTYILWFLVLIIFFKFLKRP